MTLGVVGHEAAKFTPTTRIKARLAIRDLYARVKPDLVVSGKCPLGGIDIWAIEIANRMGIPTKEYPPKVNSWALGYKPRNLLIAQSDLVVCVSVIEYPKEYKGMRFNKCYHCGSRNQAHVKGGGCWTAWQCKEREFIFI